VCVCARTGVYAYVYTYTYTHTSGYAYMYTYTYTHTYSINMLNIYMHKCTFISKRTSTLPAFHGVIEKRERLVLHIYVQVHTYTYTCTYICICKYMIYIYVYVNIYLLRCFQTRCRVPVSRAHSYIDTNAHRWSGRGELSDAFSLLYFWYVVWICQIKSRLGLSLSNPLGLSPVTL